MAFFLCLSPSVDGLIGIYHKHSHNINTHLSITLESIFLNCELLSANMSRISSLEFRNHSRKSEEPVSRCSAILISILVGSVLSTSPTQTNITSIIDKQYTCTNPVHTTSHSVTTVPVSNNNERQLEVSLTTLLASSVRYLETSFFKIPKKTITYVSL